MPFYPGGSGGGSGTVTEVDTGAGLTGGPINTAGTIVAAWQADLVDTIGSGLDLTAGNLSATGGGGGGFTVLNSGITFGTTHTAGGNTEQTLQTFTIPAGTLTNNGKVVDVFASGGYSASTRSKVLKVYFGSMVFTCPAVAVTTDQSWQLNMRITETDSQQQHVALELLVGSTTNLLIALVSAVFQTDAAENDAAPIVTKITGTVAGAAIDFDLFATQMLVTTF